MKKSKWFPSNKYCVSISHMTRKMKRKMSTVQKNVLVSFRDFRGILATKTLYDGSKCIYKKKH